MSATAEATPSERFPYDDAAVPLTVLHLAAPATVGGLEQVVYALATGHQGRGHRVHVAAVLDPGEEDHPFVSDLRRAGIEVHAVTLGSRAYARERAFVSTLCRQIGPTAVHTHGYRSDVVDGPVARRLGIPSVSTVHGFTRGKGRGRLYEWLQRRALRRFDAVVAVSRPQMLELAQGGVAMDRLHYVPNAWSGRVPCLPRALARQELSIRADVFHIGWVGRISWEKGPDILLEALAELRDLPIVASFVGEGRERRRLEAHAERNRTADRIRWQGLVPNASRIFPAFDLFVLSSRTEGTPIALFEAMAAGVPILATAVGGVPDVVTSAEALLVPAENAGALAAGIRAVYTDRQAALARASSARDRVVREYASGPWLARYEAIYHQLRPRRHRESVKT